MYVATWSNVTGGYTHTNSYMHAANYTRLCMALSCDQSVLVDSMPLLLHLSHACQQRQSLLQLAAGTVSIVITCEGC